MHWCEVRKVAFKAAFDEFRMSGAKISVFPHNDMVGLRNVLQDATENGNSKCEKIVLLTQRWASLG